MALDKLVDSAQLDSDLGDVADAIRAKSGGSSQLAFPLGFISEIGSIQTGGGSQNTRITIVSPTAKLTDFIALLPSGHENEGFSATALNKPQSGYYLASLSGKVTPGNDFLAYVRSSDVGTTGVTASTGQAWGGVPTQAGMVFEVIFYEL